MQKVVVGSVHGSGVSGLNTVPSWDGGVGIVLGSTRTWNYEAPLVLSTNATLVPSVEITGDVSIRPPCVAALKANATQGDPLLHGGLADVYRLLIPTKLACVPEVTVSPNTM
jgi:hypothetical protein